jgi:cysteine-rich repeat protein
MSPRPLASAVLLACLCATPQLGCGNDDRPPPARQSAAGGGGSAGAATGAEAGSDQLGPGGSAAAVLAGAGGAGLCGDSVRDDEEQCDGADTGGVRCSDLGFDSGTLGCNADCTFNTDQCSGTEDCYDSLDNDGDGRADCLDLDDCASACAAPCVDPPLLQDPGTAWGNTEASADETSSSCAATDGGGTELAYELVVAHTGVLELSLETAEPLSLSVRVTCDAPDTELGCSYDELRLPATAGEMLFLIVEGRTLADAGAFRLSVASRALEVCGDGYRDAGEECDDGAQLPGDGCDESCRVESSESEEDANVYAEPFYGQIRPLGDVDVVEVELTDAAQTMTVETLNLNDGSCAAGLMDSYLQIIGPDAVTAIASDDDSADGYCARAVASDLEPGTSYVVVSAAEDALPERAVFPYWLYVVID